MYLLGNEHQSWILVEKERGNKSNILLFQVKLAKSNLSRVTANRLRKLAAFDPRKFGQWFADHRCHVLGCPLVTVFHNSEWLPTHRALPTSIPNSITLIQILWFKTRIGQWAQFKSTACKHNPSPNAGGTQEKKQRDAKMYVQFKVIYFIRSHRKTEKSLSELEVTTCITFFVTAYIWSPFIIAKKTNAMLSEGWNFCFIVFKVLETIVWQTVSWHSSEIYELL